MEAGYVPAGVTVIGFIVTATVMDTGTVAVVHSVLLGSTALVAGLTNAQAGTSGLYPCVPTTTTAATVVECEDHHRPRRCGGRDDADHADLLLGSVT